MSVIIFAGCDSKIFNLKLNEGQIDYEVTYPVMDPGNVMVDFMPNSMTLRFKDDKFITELSAGMGMFKTNFIGDGKTHEMSHLVKLVNKKYLTKYNDESIKKLNDAYEDFTIIETDETKEIAGYDCKKLWIIFYDITMPSFELYYTQDISIKDPNFSLPYLNVSGVLMEYQMKRNGIIMSLKATNVSESKIDDAEFNVPEEYETISISEMEDELNALFETFNY